MHAISSRWWFSLAITIIVLVSLGWRSYANAKLREAVALEQRGASALEPLQAEHTKLLQAQPAELADSVVNPGELQQMREKVDALRRQVGAQSASSVLREDFVVGRDIPAREWRNAGTSTAAAALETALWAGAGGEINAFAKLLRFVDTRTTKSAQALFESVPQSLRDQYPSPEELIAFLTVKDVPLGSVRMTESSELAGLPSPARNVYLILTSADGTRKNANLVFMKSDDGWKLVVTDGVVARYASALHSPASQATDKP